MANNLNKQLIYDVGAHRGEDARFYLAKGFDVVAVEANPVLAAELRQRFASFIESGRLTIVEVAISRQSGHEDFFINEQNSAWGTASPIWMKRNEQLGTASSQIRVSATTFGELLDLYGVPYYLKIDIEGADTLCLEALTPERRPVFVSIESNKTAWLELVREFDLLQDAGYTKFKVVSQRNVPQQRPTSPATEGIFVSHRFEWGSSGLFGNELPGKWLSRVEALTKYKWIFRTYRFAGDTGLIGRVPILRTFRNIPVARRFLTASWYDTHAM
jgi:FkbM family methyltransferase